MSGIAVVDYGLGNLHSVLNALSYLGANAFVSGDREEILSADGVILPGVGAFGDAAARLRKRGLWEPLRSGVGGKPLLGICLGMQLLFDNSEEFGTHEGLGLMGGRVSKISFRDGMKIPHMGWNSLRLLAPCPLTEGLADGAYVYFVHSYRARAQREQLAATAEYGEEIPALVRKDRVFGAQFHPEKSGEAGLRILKNFIDYTERKQCYDSVPRH